MDRRMYFVLPDLNVARRVERSLLLARVAELGALIQDHFPVVRDCSVDATFPAFP